MKRKSKKRVVYLAEFGGEIYVKGIRESQAERGGKVLLLPVLRNLILKHRTAEESRPETRELVVAFSPMRKFTIGDDFISTDQAGVDWLRKHFPASYKVEWK